MISAGHRWMWCMWGWRCWCRWSRAPTRRALSSPSIAAPPTSLFKCSSPASLPSISWTTSCSTSTSKQVDMHEWNGCNPNSKTPAISHHSIGTFRLSCNALSLVNVLEGKFGWANVMATQKGVAFHVSDSSLATEFGPSSSALIAGKSEMLIVDRLRFFAFNSVPFSS